MYRDCGVHDFDIIRFVTGQEAVEVYATGTNQGADFFKKYDDPDTSAARPLTSACVRVCCLVVSRFCPTAFSCC